MSTDPNQTQNGPRLMVKQGQEKLQLFLANSRKLIERWERKIKQYKFWPEIGAAVAAVLLWLVGIYGLYFSAPLSFPNPIVIRIDKGSTVRQVAQDLYAKNLIRSPYLFIGLAKIFGSSQVLAGDYRFLEPTGVITIASRLTGGIFGIEVSKVTVVEGMSNKEIADLLANKLPIFDEELFLKIAANNEGKLFPDTYFIKPNDNEADMANMMLSNYQEKTKNLVDEINRSGHTETEILTMASIIELEARTPKTRRIVSGILWQRIAKGMKLQVDCVFPYIMNKYSLKLTVDDLQYDSPYNTYKYAGLPPGPIGNPGLDSIKAALEPTKTNYLYYLSDKNGVMYYATTYQGHLANRKKYLPGL